MYKVLTRTNKENKNYLEVCLEQWRYFYPFLCLVEILLVDEVEATHKFLVSHPS